jgi:SAM-dependent methyltransferase
MTKQAIDVGCENGHVIESYIEQYQPEWVKDIQITRLDLDPLSKPDVLHDIRMPMPPELSGQFDFVSFTHVLEHMPWRIAVPVFKNVAQLTKPGGMFLVCVPSLEYACHEVIRGNFDKGVLALIYGGQDDEYAFHLSGYTRPALENLTKQIKFQIMSFRETQIGIVIDGDKEHAFAGRQWELMLRRPDELLEMPTITAETRPIAAANNWKDSEPAVVTKHEGRNRHPKGK